MVNKKHTVDAKEMQTSGTKKQSAKNKTKQT